MENKKQSIQQQFNSVAQHYDTQRKKLIPCFDDYYSIATSLCSIDHDEPTVLDLGAGTGLFSSYILQKYPKAKITLIDLSEGMLEIAKERFQNNFNINYIISDYTKYTYPEKYDIVISSLSIHHLEDNEKLELFNTIYNLLNANGLFVNADQVLGETSFLESLYKEHWLQYVEASGLESHEIAAAIERTKLDKMTTLHQQLSWLNDIGFSDVDCMYKYFNFVVMYARK